MIEAFQSYTVSEQAGQQGDKLSADEGDTSARHKLYDAQLKVATISLENLQI